MWSTTSAVSHRCLFPAHKSITRGCTLTGDCCQSSSVSALSAGGKQVSSRRAILYHLPAFRTISHLIRFVSPKKHHFGSNRCGKRVDVSSDHQTALREPMGLKTMPRSWSPIRHEQIPTMPPISHLSTQSRVAATLLNCVLRTDHGHNDNWISLREMRRTESHETAYSGGHPRCSRRSRTAMATACGGCWSA